MNFLLSLNKKIFLFFSFLFIILILFVFLSKFFESTNNSENKITINKKTSDISEPKFSINSEDQKISVTANEGNFLTEDEIALEKNVEIVSDEFELNGDLVKIYFEKDLYDIQELIASNGVNFKSNKFKIYTDNVVFNKKPLVASSQDKSKFISNNSSIDSAGFDIIENGNIINFKGKTKLVLK